MKKIAFALGSNLGDRQANFDQALEALAKAGLKDIQLATPIKSAPVDCPDGSEDFLNSSGIAKTNLSPIELLNLFQRLELEIGRLPKDQRVVNAPRPIDIDILLYEDLIMETDRLTIPHSRMCERDFVLFPLEELAADWLIPHIKQTVSQAANILREKNA